jgi:hypothetical protein
MTDFVDSGLCLRVPRVRTGLDAFVVKILANFQSLKFSKVENNNLQNPPWCCALSFAKLT